jgi:hypothetical protein
MSLELQLATSFAHSGHRRNINSIGIGLQLVRNKNRLGFASNHVIRQKVGKGKEIKYALLADVSDKLIDSDGVQIVSDGVQIVSDGAPRPGDAGRAGK